ncbi:MAG: HPr family phosphocarrier protein [Clostridiaceae bacterium]
MKSKNVIITSKTGIKSRNASKVVKKAMSFNSNIILDLNGSKADAKSLINVLALNASKESKINVSASGLDEEIAVKELVNLISSLV